MVQVDLTSNTFNRLQKLAVPLVDTLDSVIARVLDAYEAGQGATSPISPSNGNFKYGASSFPNLTHTKVLNACLNGSAVPNPNWNKLYFFLVREAGVSAKKPDQLRRLILTNHQIGKKEDEGYQYLADQGISIQGSDANGAAKAMFHIAKQMNWSLEVEFAWRQKEGAEFPGQIATITI